MPYVPAAFFRLAVLLGLLLFGGPQGEPPTLDFLAPHASGVCLAEVAEVKEVDSRGFDGNLDVVVKLRVARRSGYVQDTIRIVKAFGGLRPPGESPPKLRGPLKPSSFTAGHRYWIAFASSHQLEEYPQQVVNYWPEDDTRVSAIMEEAIRADTYRWSPQYDPKSDVTYGFVADPNAEQWRVRVERSGKSLWEKAIQGTKSPSWRSCYLDQYAAANFPSKAPPSGSLLVVETSKTLESENEFGVPADKYYILAALDPETGQRVVNIVALQTNPGSPVLYRELDSKTDKPEREERYELLNSGGLKAGATTERWYRKLVRFYDRATGKVVKEEVFRYDEKVPDSHWTKVPG